jgi:hypothetical protein
MVVVVLVAQSAASRRCFTYGFTTPIVGLQAKLRNLPVTYWGKSIASFRRLAGHVSLGRDENFCAHFLLKATMSSVFTKSL